VTAPAEVRRRRAVVGVLGLAAVALAVAWAIRRIDHLSLDTQATNPLVRWEWVFKRPQTRHELWAATVQHLQLTLLAVGIGIVISALLSAVALRLRWTFTPITTFTGFLYTIPSVALFGLLATRFGNTASAEVALVSYTLLVLVRNMVAGIDGVPRAAVDAADGLGMPRLRRLVTVEVPLALPVIVAGIRVATVTTVGLVGISAIIQLGGLGVFIFDGYATQFTTKVIVGSVLSIALAVALDAGFHVVEAALTPWTRRGQAS
jgi:osmoprotectant transport system permease protein